MWLLSSQPTRHSLRLNSSIEEKSELNKYCNGIAGTREYVFLVKYTNRLGCMRGLVRSLW